MKSCKILNVARLLALALVAVLLIPACLPVAHAATATKLALLMEAEKYQYIEGDMFDPEGLVLRVTYDDGTTQNITEGFTFDERPLTLEDEEVMISTISPVCSLVSSVTMRWFTLAPTHLLPTAEWMR